MLRLIIRTILTIIIFKLDKEDHVVLLGIAHDDVLFIDDTEHDNCMAIACYFTIFDFLLDFLQEHVFEVEVERQV